MKYDIIFYKSGKTGLCEKQIKKFFGAIGFAPDMFLCTVAPQEFADALVASLQTAYLAVIVGPLGTQMPDCLEDILSNMLANTQQAKPKKLKAKFCPDGYIITCGSQIILTLPDEPREIEFMLTQFVADEILSIIKL
ncbi:MAG: hypothetical protein LBM65_02390 [Oscillospiraceae bacterium]|nr:hypothetical protein [Oscillospiraceae bacterium]